MKRVTPYNTGKVQIGLAYHPRPRIETTPDMDRLQSALLNKRDNSLSEILGHVLWAIALIVMAVLVFIATK